LPEEDKRKLDYFLLMFVVTSGSAFRIVENVFLRLFVKTMMDLVGYDYELPSRYSKKSNFKIAVLRIYII
jgi:hypothetical protein